MKQSTFNELLAFGIAAEDQVYNWLRVNYSFVQDMRYQKHGKERGPRLDGQSGSVILPDFAFYDRFRGYYLVDVKAKTTIYHSCGKMFFTVEDYKFRDYIRCVELLRADGLKIIFVYAGDMYMYDADDNLGITTFGDKDACLFELDNKRIIT